MSKKGKHGMTRFSEMYTACWQAWDNERADTLSRRRMQWRVMGDFMWAAFCVQWVAVSWAAVVGKESGEILPCGEAKESEAA